MSERYQGTLEGFRPSANPQPESPPSSTDYMLMLKGLVTAAQADISSVIDPRHLTTEQVTLTQQTLADKITIDELTPFDFGFFAAFCTDAGRFYANLQADALKSGDKDSFVACSHKMEIAKVLQDKLLAIGLNHSAAARYATLECERK